MELTTCMGIKDSDSDGLAIALHLPVGSYRSSSKNKTKMGMQEEV